MTKEDRRLKLLLPDPTEKVEKPAPLAPPNPDLPDYFSAPDNPWVPGRPWFGD